MRILLIRHGEPDYAVDGLTEKGKREAALLANRIAQMKIAAFYVSPLGRALDTAAPALEKTGRTAQICDWLQEFPTKVTRPDRPQGGVVAWDWLPQDWTAREKFFRYDTWYEEPEFAEVKTEYQHVIGAFDALLAAHGYERDGFVYRALRPNRDTLVFFCHFGIACVLMSHLMNVSPMILWHHTVLAPTSVTGFYTEERIEGTASFRANQIGDISHLYAGGEEPSFAARYCETYDGTNGASRGILLRDPYEDRKRDTGTER